MGGGGEWLGGIACGGQRVWVGHGVSGVMIVNSLDAEGRLANWCSLIWIHLKREKSSFLCLLS